MSSQVSQQVSFLKMPDGPEMCRKLKDLINSDQAETVLEKEADELFNYKYQSSTILCNIVRYYDGPVDVPLKAVCRALSQSAVIDLINRDYTCGDGYTIIHWLAEGNHSGCVEALTYILDLADKRAKNMILKREILFTSREEGPTALDNARKEPITKTKQEIIDLFQLYLA
jgi:hypothetical protein